MHIIDGQDVQHYCFYYSNRLPTITICYCSINQLQTHHLMFPWKYVVAWSFTYTLVSTPFLRNVPIKRYLHLSTATHKFVVIYSLSWMHCTVQPRTFPISLSNTQDLYRFSNSITSAAGCAVLMPLTMFHFRSKSNYVYKVCYYIVDSNC